MTISRTQNRPFYFHKGSNTTIWIRPTKDTVLKNASQPKPISAPASDPAQTPTTTPSEAAVAADKDAAGETATKSAAAAAAAAAAIAAPERKPPTGPSRSQGSGLNTPSEPRKTDPPASVDHVKNAYAARNKPASGPAASAAPVGPRGDRDRDREGLPRNGSSANTSGRRPRSPSPRRDDAKRYRRDDGPGFNRRTPPLSAKPAAVDRRTLFSIVRVV